MKSLGPFNMLGLTILGIALLWSVSLVYGARRQHSDDLIKRVLMMTGWLLILTGVFGVLTGLGGIWSLLLWAVVFVVGVMIIGKYQDSERRALLWALAVAAEKGIPLHEAVRAFANERPFSLGRKATHLASLLEGGMRLPDALLASGNPLPMDALLAARLGDQTGMLGPALRQVIEHVDVFESALRSILENVLYLLIVSVFSCCVITFVMIKIVPVMQMMFNDFSLALPPSTQFLITVSDFYLAYWYLFLPIYVVLLSFCMVGMMYYVGWLNFDVPLVSRFWIRTDGAMVLRTLHLTVRQQRALPETIQMLAQQYPKRDVRRRLQRAFELMRKGQPWAMTLYQVGLLRPAEVGVLRAAERVGNLSWALQEMSESIVRRVALRLRAFVNVFFPLLLLVFAAFVALVTIGMFRPLIQLIEGLS